MNKILKIIAVVLLVFIVGGLLTNMSGIFNDLNLFENNSSDIGTENNDIIQDDNFNSTDEIRSFNLDKTKYLF